MTLDQLTCSARRCSACLHVTLFTFDTRASPDARLPQLPRFLSSPSTCGRFDGRLDRQDASSSSPTSTSSLSGSGQVLDLLRCARKAALDDQPTTYRLEGSCGACELPGRTLVGPYELSWSWPLLCKPGEGMEDADVGK